MSDVVLKKKRRIWWLVGISLVVMLFIASITGLGSGLVLKRKLAEARSSGFPVEPEDLLPDSIPSDEENAAEFYEQMVDLPVQNSRKFQLMERHQTALTYGFSSFDRDQVLSFFELNAKLIELAEKASGRPECYFEKDWSNPITVIFPEFRISKQASKLFASRATLKLEKGDVEGALEDLNRILIIARHIEDSGYLMGQYIATSERIIYASSVEQMSAFPTADEEFYNGVLTQLDQWPSIIDLSNELRIEAYSNTWITRNIDQFFGEDYNSGVFESGWPQDEIDWEELSYRLPKTRNDATLFALEHWKTILDTYSPDLNDPLSWARSIDSNLPTGSGFWEASEGLVSWFIYHMEPIVSSGISSSARREVLVSSLEAILAKIEGKEYLNNGIGLDPWSGTNLIFKETNEGFIIYSIGQNGIDDGGEKERNVDYVFEFPFERPSLPTDFFDGY